MRYATATRYFPARLDRPGGRYFGSEAPYRCDDCGPVFSEPWPSRDGEAYCPECGSPDFGLNVEPVTFHVARRWAIHKNEQKQEIAA